MNLKSLKKHLIKEFGARGNEIFEKLASGETLNPDEVERLSTVLAIAERIRDLKILLLEILGIAGVIIGAIIYFTAEIVSGG